MMGFKLVFLLAAVCFTRQPAYAQERYVLKCLFTDKDTTAQRQSPVLLTDFRSRSACVSYIEGLASSLRSKGYLAASIDSVAFDSTGARLWLFLGEAYQWTSIALPLSEAGLLESAGWEYFPDSGDVVDFHRLEASKEKLIGFLGNNGYPFASIKLDSIRLDGSRLSARILLERGPLYRIDSILPVGDVKISRNFLYRYLDIPAGSIYKKVHLNQISRKLLELSFLKETRPWDMTMLGTGSTVNLYLEEKKSSQMNLLVGFLPDNTQVGGKLLLTGEANMNLRNAFGTGETIAANWQQIQVQSPRLNLAYNQPYVFHSAFGLDTYFDFLRKDSSFLNLSARLGLQYLVSARQTGKLFFQQQSTNLLTVDTALIKSTKRLPVYLDVTNSQLGVDYQFAGTDYRNNPRKGMEASLTLSGGVRRIRENGAITGLKEDASGKPFDFSSLYDTIDQKQYLIRVKASLTRFFMTSRQSTLKFSLQGGSIFSRDLFRNELFQIGGYRLLRGFDEESIFAKAYGVGTLEYRYLIGLNSFLFAFTDIGFAGVSDHTDPHNHRYLGAGMGLSFETRAGIFNLAYAAGKRDDLPLDLRQSKIHFGLVSFF